MLKQVRSALKGVLAWFVIALLVLAFALWGVPEMRNFTQKAPMRVGDAGFSAAAIQTEYNRLVQRRREEAGGKFTAADARAQGLPDLLVTQIATRSVIEQEADRLGLVIPTRLVREFLEANENFQNPATGKFDQLALQSILDSNSMSAEEFQSIIRQDLLRNQLVASISAGAPAPKAFAEALMLRETERRRVGYLTITDDMAGAPAQASPDALKTYYESKKAEFQSPEYRTFAAVILRPDDFGAGAAPAEDALRKVYDASRARYESPEKRTLYQITYDSEAAANAAAATLRQGKPFESIAEAKGLSLAAATFTDIAKKDLLDPAVATAAFAADLAPGAAAGPIKGVFGWTVVQLVAVTPAQTKTFEEVRDEIVAAASVEGRKKELFEAVEALEEARDTGAVLADAAAKAGVKVVQYGPVDSFSFARGGAIVADVPGEVLAEAFKLGEGEESDSVELPEGGYFFVQVEKVDPPATLPFAEIENEVAARWRKDERERRIGAAIKQVTDAVAAGKKLEAAAAPFNRAVIEKIISRGGGDDAFSPALAEKAFSADLGAVISGDAGSAGAQTIVEIREIGYNRNAIGAGEEIGYQQFLGSQLNQEYVEAYLSALREDYGVKTDSEQLAALFSEGQ